MPTSRKRRVRPQLRADALLARLARGVRLDQARADLPHRGLDRLADAGELVLGVEAAADEVALDLRDRVAVAPGRLLQLAAVAEGAARERAVLVEVAVGVGLDDGRATAVTHVLAGLLHGEVDRHDVLAVDLPAGDAETQPARGQPRLAGGLLDGRRHRVLVVLDEEADRELPRRGQVHRLQDGADVRGAVAEVGDRDVVGVGPLVGEGEAGGERDRAPDDGVGAHRTGVDPLQVHRPAAAVAVAVLEPGDLRHALVQHLADLLGQRLAGVHAVGGDVADRLGQELVVPAVGAVDLVRAHQREHRADRARLLADARVRRAVDQLLARQAQDLLLERPDEVELGEHRVEDPRLQGVPVGVGGRERDPRGERLQWRCLRHLSPRRPR